MSSNYALDSPITRNVYVPGESEIPFAPASNDLPPPRETDQTHRHLQWLFHKPQNSVIFPIEPQAAKINKKTSH
jgi:hypothetical protein